MNALIRAALVGAVVGLAQVVIVLRGPQNDAANLVLMLFAPLPLGMLLSWYAMLRNWWLVSLLGQFAVIALYAGLTMTAPVSALVGFGDWRLGLIVMTAGACGYALGAGLAMPAATPLRVSAVGVAASLFLAAWSNQEVIALAAQEQAMADRNIPHVAPDLPGFRLTETTVDGPELFLQYQRPGADILFEIRQGTMTPEQACEDELDLQNDETCVEVSQDVWALRTEYGSSMFAAFGDAALEICSANVPEKRLLAALGTVRPISIWELAAPVYE
ncbi:hypothetical protein ACIBIZ_17220 [Nonomuraea spiralis]|uniref:hypothetical protein n=1 Tax=Nonomuraea spiralis TaxID=46182 RepID=UPI0037B71299